MAKRKKPPKPELKKFEVTVDLIKSDMEQVVYGVVLTPDLVDSQGDTINPQEIEKAAHRWMEEYQSHDVQHDGEPVEAAPVESFIAPVDFELGGQEVRKGSWVVATHIRDADAWALVEKGELTGYSIGGSGERLFEDE